MLCFVEIDGASTKSGSWILASLTMVLSLSTLVSPILFDAITSSYDDSKSLLEDCLIYFTIIVYCSWYILKETLDPDDFATVVFDWDLSCKRTRKVMWFCQSRNIHNLPSVFHCTIQVQKSTEVIMLVTYSCM